MSDFGLIQITRKRARRSLERTLCRPCPTCHGSGRIKTALTIASDILMDIRCKLAHQQLEAVEVRAHPEVVERIEAESESFVASLGERQSCQVTITSDPALSLEEYAVEVP